MAEKVPVLDWAEKYRPKTLSEMINQSSAIKTLREWAREWEKEALPKKRAVILYGPPGVGKTTAAHALANEMGWDAIEVNASDVRNAEMIKKIIGGGALNDGFTPDGEFVSSKKGRRKILIVDEADSLYERRSGEEEGEDSALDRGGKRALLEVLRETRQPTIIIVNDLYELIKDNTGKEIKRLAIPIRFGEISYRDRLEKLAVYLQKIGAAEGVRVPIEVARKIAERSGDVRSAINDLQAIALGKKVVTLEDVEKSGVRDLRTDMWKLTGMVLKSRVNGKRAFREIQDLDEDPNYTILWFEENLPGAYTHPYDIANGFEALAKSDLFLGRAWRTRHYRFYVYANFFMTMGLALAKRESLDKISRTEFPSWLKKMSASKERRKIRTGMADKLGRWTHVSKNSAMEDVLPFFQVLFKKDPEFRVEMAYKLNLSPQEIEFLMKGMKKAEVEKTIEEVEKLRSERGLPGADRSTAFWGSGVKAETETEKEGAEGEENAEEDAETGEDAGAEKTGAKETGGETVEEKSVGEMGEETGGRAEKTEKREGAIEGEKKAEKQKTLFDFSF